MANGDDSGFPGGLPPMPGADGGAAAPAEAAAPFADYTGKKLPKGLTTKKPTKKAGAEWTPPPMPGADTGAAAAPAAAPAVPGDEVSGAIDTAKAGLSAAKEKTSGLIPQWLKDRYHNVQQTIGVPAEQFYEQYLAHPANKVVGTAAQDVYQQVTHPEWSMRQGLDQIQRDIHTPYDQLPETARDVAEVVVPQDIPSAALTALSFGMPGVGKAREVGEAANWGQRVLGNRLARIGAGGLVGGVTGGLTGQGVTSGALGGATSFALPEAVGAGIQKVSRRLGESSLIRSTTAKVGKAIQERAPFLGKLETGDDFDKAFVQGGARNKARAMLDTTKKEMTDLFGNDHFSVPYLDENTGRIVPKDMTFADADSYRTNLQQDYGYSLQGERKGGYKPRHLQKLAFDVRDALAQQMDAIHSGAGKAYRKRLSQFDIADTMAKVFKKEGLFHPQYGLNQPELIDRLGQHAEKLDRAFGSKGTTNDFLNVIKRGFVGQGKDLPRKAAMHNWSKHIVGSLVGAGVGGAMGYPGLGATAGAFYGTERGQPFDPAGKVPWAMRPQMDAAEALLNQGIARYRRGLSKPTISPAITAAQQQRAQDVAGPTASADRVSMIRGHTEAIARGDSPNVQHDLETHNLSTGNVRKMLDNSNSRIETAFNGLSPSDAVDAFSKADKGEREMLLPILIQHIQNTGQNMPPQQRQQLLAQLQAAMASEGTA